MKYANTYKYKLNAVKQQINSYDVFLQQSALDFDSRIKISQEIARLVALKNSIEALPIHMLDADCKDFNLKVNSSINENRTKTELRYTYGRKSDHKQGV